jgi:hypothetical protein
MFTMIRSIRLLSLLAVLILSQTVTTHASDPYTQAYLKWDAGDYIGALKGFLEIMDGPDADLYRIERGQGVSYKSVTHPSLAVDTSLAYL